MAASSQPVVLTDGSVDWSMGVNSIKTTTVASPLNVNGLQRSELSWLDNGTVRNGGISQRPCWVLKGSLSYLGAYHGSYVYQPDYDYPYHIAVIGGQVFKIDPDHISNAKNLSQQFGVSFPPQPEPMLLLPGGKLPDHSGG